MKIIKLLLSIAITGVVVALIYYVFETAVHKSIDFIWVNLVNTDTKRLLVIPLCTFLTIIFFGLQHFLDRKSETHEEHGLGGEKIDTSFKKLGTILVIGFFSLVAGASLGPEAVLVPACVVAGGIVGSKLFAKDKKSISAMAGAGIIALFTAFFHSFFVGILSIFLLTKQTKAKLNAQMVILAVIASAASYFTLQIIDPKKQFFNWPEYNWKVQLIDIGIAAALVIAGYLSTLALKTSHDLFKKIRKLTTKYSWWLKGLAAGGGLSIIYLLGGDLIQFTGKESIAPLLKQAASLGLIGLLWIYALKILAIGWSKAMGYRGGLVFPMIFVASTLVAMATLLFKETNFMLGLIGAIVGIIAAERQAKILF